MDQHLDFFRAAYHLDSLQRADELVERLNFPRYRRALAGTLSGGTRQKLNLTLALMHDPTVLLLDEPYQGFDWETYLRFWDLATDLRARGCAVLVISHLFFDRDRFDCLYQLRDGLLVQEREEGAMIMPDSYLVATRYALLEHARNRLALGLLIIFVPLWFAMIGLMIPGDPVSFKLLSTGRLLRVNGHQLTLITAGFNALTLIVGFMLYASTRRGAPFDRRLVLSGYAQSLLVLAKLTALLVVALVVALYATVVLAFFWPTRTLPFVWLGFFSDALIYGGLGLLLGISSAASWPAFSS